jgi:uncharacterized protein YndB with AHSA1/START domain
LSSPSDQTVVDERITIAVPAERVWHAIIDSDARRAWWGYLDLDPQVGGRFEERWTDTDGNPKRTHGAVLELADERLLRLNWADEDWPELTEVHLSLAEDEEGTEVRVRHIGWDALPSGPALAAAHQAGWRMHLKHLRQYLEQPGAA